MSINISKLSGLRLLMPPAQHTCWRAECIKSLTQLFSQDC